MKMLLCTISSERRERTLGFGLQVAKALATETTLLGVAEKEQDLTELERALNQAADRLRETGLPVQVHLTTGPAERIVMTELEEWFYDLVAIGALGIKRSRRAILDSVGMRLVERGKNSVLLIKGDRPPQLKRVLIAISGTEQGHLPVWAGASLACGADAQATVLHVLGNLPAMYTGLERMEETLDELLQADTELAREMRWAAQVVKAECRVSEVKLRRGVAADEILKEGREGDYDVIVLGSSRQGGGLVRALLGDLTREVAQRADRPVLVVRPRD